MNSFSAEEMRVMTEVRWHQVKQDALTKVRMLLEKVRSQLEPHLDKQQWQQWGGGTNVLSGKISQGDNYQGLPYLILDYPAIFSGHDLLAYRTMFWWGHEFSITLHIQGVYWQKFRPVLLRNLNAALAANWYLCIADTPWEYHFGADNFVPLQANHRLVIDSAPFLKLSLPIGLEEYGELPDAVMQFYRLSSQILEFGEDGG